MVFNRILHDNLSTLFLQLDFEAAFDKVDFPYIWATLTAMGLRGQFLKLIQGLTIGGSVKIHINGQFSESIPMERGVRQGCPIAPMLFAICTQPLLAFLQVERLKGRMLGVRLDASILICNRMFANDLGVFIPTTKHNFVGLNGILTLYKQAKVGCQTQHPQVHGDFFGH